MANVYEYVIQKQASNQITSKWITFQQWNVKEGTYSSHISDGNITKYKESTGRYNPVDFYLIHNEDKIVAEIKCRDIRYVNYPTHLMETEKLKSLLAVK